MGQEFGADIINDLQGKTQNVILREKIAMRSGETDIAKLVDIPIVNETLYRLGNKSSLFTYILLSTSGICTIGVLNCKNSNKFSIIVAFPSIQ